MIDKNEIERWLGTLPDGAGVAIDEGGLSLIEVNDDGSTGEAYLEVGLTPDEAEIALPEDQ